MEDGSAPHIPVATPAKRLLHRLLAIGENRFQLLVTEVEEEREHMVDVACLAGAVAALGLLAGMSFATALVILFWQSNPVLTLCILGALFGIAGWVLWMRLQALRRRQEPLAATLDQLRKDCSCFMNSDDL